MLSTITEGKFTDPELDSVPGYKRYFMIPTEHCEVSLSETSKQGTKVCDSTSWMQVKQDRGNIGLATDYLSSLDQYRALPAILDLHLHLAEGVNKLLTKEKVHGRIGERSVFMDYDQGHVVLGDTSGLKRPEDIQSSTALETQWIAAIVSQEQWETKPVPLVTMKELTETYFEDKDATMKAKWLHYAEGFSNKRGKNVVNDLRQYWQSWDMHSVNEWCLLQMRAYPAEAYKWYISGQLVSLPEDRDDVEDTIFRIEDSFPKSSLFSEMAGA